MNKNIKLILLLFTSFLYISLSYSYIVEGSIKNIRTHTSVPYAEIYVYNTTDSLINHTISDSEGYYSLDLNSDTYYFVINATNYISNTTNIYNINENTEINFTIQDILTGSLSVNVYDSVNNRPIPDVLVIVPDSNNQNTGGNATTNANGFAKIYVIGSLESIYTKISYYHPDYINYTDYNYYTVTSGNDTYMGHVFIKGSILVQGSIEDKYNNKPVEFAQIQLMRWKDDVGPVYLLNYSNTYFYNTTTDENGNYHINVPKSLINSTNEYALNISSPGYYSHIESNNNQGYYGAYSLNTKLTGLIHISLIIRDLLSNQSLPSCLTTVTEIDTSSYPYNPEFSYSQLSDNNGYINISVRSNNQYTLSLSKYGYNPLNIPVLSGNYSNIIYLEGSSRIHGQVTDTNLNNNTDPVPLNHTKITIENQNITYIIYSDENGTFNISIPSNNTYTLTFEKTGFFKKTLTYTTHDGINDLGMIRLTGTANINGIVREVHQNNTIKNSNYTLQSVNVELHDENGNIFITKTDENGKYSINISSGINYSLTFSKSGYISITKNNNGKNYTSNIGYNNIVNAELYGSTKTNFIVVDKYNPDIFIPYANITIYSYDSNIPLYYIYSDPKGVVNINISTLSGYYIEIDKKGYKHLKSISYSKDYNLNNITMELTGLTDIDGIVIDKATGRIIEDATVQVLSCSDDTVLYSTTSTYGRFHFNTDGTVKYRIRSRRDGYETVVLDNEGRCYNTSFEFTGSNSIFMEAKFHIHVFDTYSPDNPIINALVQIFEYNDTHPDNTYGFIYNLNETIYHIHVICEGLQNPPFEYNISYYKTSCDSYQINNNLCNFSDSTYSETIFHRVPTGRYVYHVDGSQNGCTSASGYLYVTTENTGHENNIYYTLNATDLRIHITLDGNPRTNTLVYMVNNSVIQRNALGDLLNGTTDETGTIHFHHLIPMEYTIIVEDKEYGTQNRTIIITPASDERDTTIEIHDVESPQYTIYGDNTTNGIIKEKEYVLIYSHWSDNINLSRVELYTNISGIDLLYSSISSENMQNGWANFTLDTTNHAAQTIHWYLRAYDTSNNINQTPQISFYIQDSTPPAYYQVLPYNTTMIYGNNQVLININASEPVNLSVFCDQCNENIYENTSFFTNTTLLLDLPTTPVPGNVFHWNFTICDAYNNCNSSHTYNDYYLFYYDPSILEIKIYEWDTGLRVADGVTVQVSNSTYNSPAQSTINGHVAFPNLQNNSYYNISIIGNNTGYGINITYNYLFTYGTEYHAYIDTTYLRVNVTDASYTPIVGARVVVYTNATGTEILRNGFGTELINYTNSEGIALFPYIPQGTDYNVTVNATGLGKAVNINSSLVNITAGISNLVHIDPPLPGIFNVSIHLESNGSYVDNTSITLRSYNVYKSLMRPGDTRTYDTYVLKLVNITSSGAYFTLNDQTFYLSTGSSTIIQNNNITLNDLEFYGDPEHDYTIVSASSNTISRHNYTNATGDVFFSNLPSKYYLIHIEGGSKGYQTVEELIPIGYVITNEAYTDSNGDAFLNIDGTRTFYIYIYAEGYFYYDSYEHNVSFKGSYYDHYNNTGDNPIHDSIKINLTGNVEIKGHVYDYLFMTQDPYKNITNATIILKYNQINRYNISANENGTFHLNISPFSPDSVVNHPVPIEYNFIIRKNGYHDYNNSVTYSQNTIYNLGEVGLNASGYFRGHLYNIITKEIIDSILNPGNISIYRLNDNVEMYRSIYKDNKYYVSLNPYYNPYTISFNIRNFEDLNNYGVYNASVTKDLYLYPKGSCYLNLNFFDENNNYLNKINISITNNLDFNKELYYESNSHYHGFSESCGASTNGQIIYFAEFISSNGAYQNTTLTFTTDAGKNQTINLSINSTRLNLTFYNQDNNLLSVNNTIILSNTDYHFEKTINSSNIILSAIPLGTYTLEFKNTNSYTYISNNTIIVSQQGEINNKTIYINETKYLITLQTNTGTPIQNIELELNYLNTTNSNGIATFSEITPQNYTLWINNSKIIRNNYFPITDSNTLLIPVEAGKLPSQGNNKTITTSTNNNHAIFEIKLNNQNINAIAILRNQTSILDQKTFDKYSYAYLSYNTSEHPENVYVEVSATGYTTYTSQPYNFTTRTIIPLSITLSTSISSSGSGGGGGSSKSGSSSSSLYIPAKKQEPKIYSIDLLDSTIHIKNYECSRTFIIVNNTGNQPLSHIKVYNQSYPDMNISLIKEIDYLYPGNTKDIELEICSNTFFVGAKDIELEIQSDQKTFTKTIKIIFYQNDYQKLIDRYKYLYNLYSSLDPNNMSEEQYALYEQLYNTLNEAYNAIQNNNYALAKQKLNDANELYNKIQELYNQPQESKNYIYLIISAVILLAIASFSFYKFYYLPKNMVSPINPVSGGYSYKLNTPQAHTHTRHKTLWKKIIRHIKVKILKIEKDYSFFTDVYGNNYFSDIIRVVENIPHRCHVCGSRLQNGVCPVCGNTP